MNKYDIEKNVPLPARGKWAILARQMEVNDSVLLENSNEAKCLVQAIQAIGFKASSRNVNTVPRVWKLEK